MLFNSYIFILFFVILFSIYWFVLKDKLQEQNIFLLLSSYIFYGWWDWRFCSLILFSTIVDYYCGNKINETDDKVTRKKYLYLSVFFNLSLLGFFKYYNFFIASFASAFESVGVTLGVSSLNIILPVGISFYTFQTMSYTIDIYKKEMSPATSFITFATFVSFFPQLVAGPIERAKALLPQLEKKREFSYENSIEGFYYVLWGLFKKIVIADNCATLVDRIFQSQDFTGSILIVGVVLFAFQIYCDFSGYSDIAIGIAKLLGIRLMINFKFPYFSRNIGEFWRRWHISLSTWFRDYVYIPLGGSRLSKLKNIRNVFIVFVVSGFWHGANWTFVVWGVIHALLFIPSFLLGRNRKYKNVKIVNSNITARIKNLSSIVTTFILINFAWIFFRAESMNLAVDYIGRIFQKGLLKVPKLLGAQNTDMLISFIFIGILLIIEWIHKDKDFVFDNIYNQSMLKKLSILSFLFISIYYFGGTSTGFIYFQF